MTKQQKELIKIFTYINKNCSQKVQNIVTNEAFSFVTTIANTQFDKESTVFNS